MFEKQYKQFLTKILIKKIYIWCRDIKETQRSKPLFSFDNMGKEVNICNNTKTKGTVHLLATRNRPLICSLFSPFK
jgi:hypothetical protein